MTAPPLGRDYRLLWSAAVSSRLGDALRTPALALLAATLTRDPRVIAAVTVAGQLPPLLFGLLGGVYADRWDRRRTMAVVDGLRAAVVGGLAVAVSLDRAGVAALVTVAFLLAALGTLFDSASFALLPSVVPPAALPRANGRLQAGSAVAGGFLGAPAAGVLFALAAPLPFAIDALTFLCAALLTLALRPTPPRPRRPETRPRRPETRPRRPERGPESGRARTVWREAVEGVRWVRGDAMLWRLTVATAGSNLAISGLMAVLVLYALDVLRVPTAGYGLFAAGAVLGGLAGGLGAGRLAARLGTVPALRLVLAGQAVALTGLALARHPVPGGLALAVFAAGTTVWNSLWASYGQRHVPAALLGRVGAAQRLVGLLTAPVGAALAGLGGAAYGVGPVAAALAGVFVLVTLAVWRLLRPVPPAPAALFHRAASRATHRDA
ncbi:MFS-type transporter involved in bile tolerance, Atg22 family [Micromonospora echinofusca]|uniref:MFS-type transporter involved in bile tolerance, Atg22 family n=1 Tax=Micromonospora echinofusca TaxID=47858 RepID=A0A1C5GHH1_MICEH|nr:MFS transporter [Micromonospora echinofusca]SCG19271.1 MFS-type transporter involved in bile tolerance, Atg22 family [Micromonospora echinofusca]